MTAELLQVRADDVLLMEAREPDARELFEMVVRAVSYDEIRPERIAYEIEREPGELSLEAMQRIASRLGFTAERRVRSPFALKKLPKPFLTSFRTGEIVAVIALEAGSVVVQLPGQDARPLPPKDFLGRWSGITLELAYSTAPDVTTKDARRATWDFFIQPILRHKRSIAAILLMSALFQLLGLATPLFTQTILDRVLVYQVMSTLDVLAVGLVAVYVYQAVLGWLRGYILPHTMARIDAEISSKIFERALQLPMPYHDQRAVGDTVARVREVEAIRDFLTNGSLLTLVDAVFGVIVIVVLYFYSPYLATIVTVSLLFYVALSAIMSKPFRVTLEEKFDRGALQQASLIETVAGIGTLKSLAIEPVAQRRWDDSVAGYLGATFRLSRLGNVVEQSAALFEHLVTVGIMYLGALQVMKGNMTAGQLVAFNMLAGHLTHPTLKVVGLWQQFQRCKVSVDRISDLITAEPENRAGVPTMLPVRGEIELRNVSFRYRPDSADAVSGLNLKIHPGEVIGIVGRSGSGKSTLSKLVQGLYMPTHGQLLVDGQDVSTLAPRSLRRHIGVVQQDAMLFNASIAENIALADLSVDMTRIMESAKTAGAHDFITELTHGYDTIVGERGSLLSGGQRQRIAIARAIIHDPKILIFDEATSALDYESERAIQDNMSRITAGRTVIIIAHRLSTVRTANRIIVMERGKIIEQGPPDELLRQDHGHFAHLHSLQHS